MQGAFLPEWIGAGLALLVLFAFSHIQIRHLGLAAIAAFAPLPGYLLGNVLQAPSQPLGYLCGFVIADIILSTVEMEFCSGAPRADATRQAIRNLGAAVIWPLVLAVAAISAISGFAGMRLAMFVLFCGASALLIALPAARFLPYDEEFIARANRLRERRERWLDGLAFVIQPRWGWSISGIALIFAVLGLFGSPNFGAFPIMIWTMEGPLFAVIAFAAIRNIRFAIAFLLTAAALISSAVWICGHSPLGATDLVLALAVAVSPAFMTAIQSAKFARAGDAFAVASLRASEQLAIPIFFFSLASSLALVVLGLFASATLITLGGAAALMMFPAITAAVHDLFPPRVSLDAYRIR